MQIYPEEKTSMQKNTESRSFMPLLHNESAVIGIDRDISLVHAAAMKEQSRDLYTVDLTSPTEPVLIRAPNCELMEGGLGI
jgi:hypothetical protein